MAVLLGLLAVLAVPAGVVVARFDDHVSLLDAAWAIPVAAIASIAALLEIRGTSGHVRFSLSPVRTIRAGRVLAMLGACITVSSAIALGFYYLLLQLEG